MTRATTRAALRRRWWLTVVGFVAAAGGVALLVTWTIDARAGRLWLVAAAPVFGYELWFLSRVLDRTRRPGTDAEPDPTLGIATAVTLGRGWLYAGVAGFLLVVPPVDSPWRWIPAVWYGGGAALDWIDGALARSIGHPSQLGARLDMAFDTVGFLVAPLVGVVWGRLPVWYLALSAARYLFKAGRGLRRHRGRPVYEVPPSRVRRPLAGLQMAFIAVALLPLAPVSVVRPAAAVVVVPSLAVFFRDYLVVTGWLRPRAEPTTADGGEPPEQ